MGIRRRRDDLERRLGSERPQPPDELVSRLAQRLTPEPIRRRSGWSVALAAGFTSLLVVAIALTGGIGYAAGAAKDGTTAVTSLVTSSDKPGKSDESAGKSSESSGKSDSAGHKSSSDTSSSSATTSSSNNKSGSSDDESGSDNKSSSNNKSSSSDDESGSDNKSDSSDDKSGSGNGGGDKQAVCHVPPGNPDNAHTIVISVNAVQTHLTQHEGDTLGPCPEDEGPPDDEYEEKVLICHIPPGNPGNAHTISVSVNAVPAHLAHGDTEGPCPDDGEDGD